MKKSYYKLAKIFHPDRAADHDKNEASEKFNIIHHAYSILSDPSKKQQYDAGSNVLFSNITVAARWENYLKPINVMEIETARQKYRGSEAEKTDIIREFTNGKGSLTYLLNTIPYTRIEDETRLLEILKNLMAEGKIPKTTIKRLRK